MTKILSFVGIVWRLMFPAKSDFHFSRQPFESPLTPPIPITPPALPAPTITPPPIAAPTKKPRIARAKTMQKMLENIEHAFDSIGLPTDWAWAHTAKDTIIALRKIGPHVTAKPPTVMLNDPRIKTLDGKWGSLMFVAYEKIKVKDEFMEPVFCYAVLLKKAPWYVAKSNGRSIFECGAAWRDNETNKLFWGNWYVAVDKKTGIVDVCSCLNYTPKQVKGMAYTHKHWGLPPMAHAGFEVDEDKKGNVLKLIFVECFESWQIADSHWKISVSKGSQRVTWTVPQDETKHFFADRNTTVTDAGGRKKKIVHHVVQHSRELANGKTSMVREHIRGLSRFEWRGYSVNVVSPKFHLTIHEFDIAGRDEDDIPEGSKDMIYLSKAGKMLSDMESLGKRKPLPAIH